MTDATFSPKEVALAAGTTAKRLRSFIRSMEDKGTPIVPSVGSGARYAFNKAEANALIAAFQVRPISSGSPNTRTLDEVIALLEDEEDEVDEEV